MLAYGWRDGGVVGSEVELTADGGMRSHDMNLLRADIIGDTSGTTSPLRRSRSWVSKRAQTSTSAHMIPPSRYDDGTLYGTP